MREYFIRETVRRIGGRYPLRAVFGDDAKWLMKRGVLWVVWVVVGSSAADNTMNCSWAAKQTDIKMSVTNTTYQIENFS